MGESNKNNKKEGKREIGQIIRFAIVGVSNFLVDFVIYNSLLRFAPNSVEIIESILSGEISIENLKRLCVHMEILYKIILGLGLTTNKLFAHYGFCNIKTAVELGKCHTVLDTFNLP